MIATAEVTALGWQFTGPVGDLRFNCCYRVPDYRRPRLESGMSLVGVFDAGAVCHRCCCARGAVWFGESSASTGDRGIMKSRIPQFPRYDFLLQSEARSGSSISVTVHEMKYLFWLHYVSCGNCYCEGVSPKPSTSKVTRPDNRV